MSSYSSFEVEEALLLLFYPKVIKQIANFKTCNGPLNLDVPRRIGFVTETANVSKICDSNNLFLNCRKVE